MKSKEFIRKSIIFSIKIIIISASAYFIWNTDKFQQKFTPTRYWDQKVNNLQTNIHKDKYTIKSLEVDIEKEIMSNSYDQKVVYFKAKEMKENLQDLLNDLDEEHQDKINAMNQDLSSLKQNISKNEKDLDTAKDKLQSCLKEKESPHVISFSK